ncbi:hypothetical protein [Shewanella algae]|uniref:hypothetical protein n=1 Tax=Shewanella algae TaxID=38313 RepID=UPI00313ECC0E
MAHTNSLPAPLNILLPMRRYRLSFRHQQLDILGKVSRFLLQSFTLYGVTQEQIQQVTALTSSQLTPLLERLCALGWLEDDLRQLTPQGSQMALACELTELSFVLWLDVMDPQLNPVWCHDEQLLLKNNPSEPWMTLREYETDWNIQTVLQQQRLNRRLASSLENQGELTELMQQLCPTKYHRMLHEQRTAWQPLLEIIGDETELRYAWVELDSETSLTSEKRGTLLLKAPTLEYQANYTVPPLLDSTLASPPPSRLHLCQLSGAIINTSERVEGNASWPKSAEKPISELLQVIGTKDEPLDTGISRHITLNQSLRPLRLDKPQLMAALKAQFETSLEPNQ